MNNFIRIIQQSKLKSKNVHIYIYIYAFRNIFNIYIYIYTSDMTRSYIINIIKFMLPTRILVPMFTFTVNTTNLAIIKFYKYVLYIII